MVKEAMESIKVNNIIFIIKDRTKIKGTKLACTKCIFSGINMNKYKDFEHFCTAFPINTCYKYIVVRKANIFDRIIIWLKKKIKK